MAVIDKIGLVAWGLKLGKDVFFTSDNINPNDPEIVRTLEDARGIINMLNTNQLFYSLEFTDQFKVYTIYRTINDWGNRNNAYLALSLFIPYKTRFLAGVIPVLKALVKIYDDNYLDENLRIKRVQERKERFFEVINEFETSTINWSPPRPNKDSNTNYANIRYSSEQQLEEFFDNPFLEEFGPYKEIFFLEEGNDKINGVKDLPLLKVSPRALFRKIQIELKDENHQNLRMPYEFQINNLKPYQNPYTYEVQVNERELAIKVEKPGFKTFSKKYNLENEELAGNHLPIVLEKRKEASVKVVDAKHHGPLSKAIVRARMNGQNMWNTGQISNDNGEVILKDIYIDDDIFIRIECEGFEPKEQRFTATENRLIPIEKKEVLPLKESSENTNKSFISGNDQDKRESEEKIREFKYKNKQSKGTNIDKDKQSYKLDLKKIAIVGGSILGLVLLIFLALFLIKQSKKRQEIKEVKVALTDSLETYHTKIFTIFQGYGYQLDTSKAKEQYSTDFAIIKAKFDQKQDSIKAKHDDFKKQIDEFAPKDIRQDSLLLGNNIKDYYNDLIESHPIKNKELEELSKAINADIQEEQLKKQQEKDRQRYRELAKTMCDGQQIKARSYANLVHGTEMGFDTAEKDKLYEKFKLIEQMLILDYNSRTSSDQVLKEDNTKKLENLRNKNSGNLSTEQRNWLYNAINRH